MTAHDSAVSCSRSKRVRSGSRPEASRSRSEFRRRACVLWFSLRRTEKVADAGPEANQKNEGRPSAVTEAIAPAIRLELPGPAVKRVRAGAVAPPPAPAPRDGAAVKGVAKAVAPARALAPAPNPDIVEDVRVQVPVPARAQARAAFVVGINQRALVAQAPMQSPPAAPSIARADGMGLLEMDGLKLPGQLVDATEESGSSCLSWKPTGSQTASPLRPGVSGRIVYRTPAPVAVVTPPQPQFQVR